MCKLLLLGIITQKENSGIQVMVSGSKKVRHINSALDRSLLFNPGEGRALTIENMWSTKTQLMPNIKCKVNPFRIPLNSMDLEWEKGEK